mmetsp:Transcript_1728/g.1885  ORF Transcript_1728/g.1885 Transcript_1728/m.1885 type:complete len:302 (+) Transcript_1728:371-1276(+)
MMKFSSAAFGFALLSPTKHSTYKTFLSNRPSLVAKFSGVVLPNEDPVVVVKTIVQTTATKTTTNTSEEKVNNIDWDDRIGVQNKWTNKEKGWMVNVEWKPTSFGTGLFAAQDIESGTLLRVGSNGRNILELRSASDIESFCSVTKCDDENNNIPDVKNEVSDDRNEYHSRLNYVKDYLWRFNPTLEDDRGYYNSKQTNHSDSELFVCMWVPGCGLNHSPEPNTVYRADHVGGTDVGLNLVAIENIRKGEELFDDYRRYGTAPQWLSIFSKNKGVPLNFADCNDFVINDDNSKNQKQSNSIL